jgi:hypothetical protein
MIVVYKYPLFITPNMRPIIFDVGSSVSTLAHPELQIKATVYVSTGQVFNPVGIKYQSKYHNQEFFRFNFKKNIQAFLDYDLYDDSSQANQLIAPNLKGLVEYFVIFQELYNNQAGIMSVYAGAQTSTHKAGNSSIQHERAPDMTLDEWTIYNTTLAPAQFIDAIAPAPSVSQIITTAKATPIKGISKH